MERPRAAASSGLTSEARTWLRETGRLPIVKRKQAHFRIDGELDQLEQMLFEATLPSS